MFFKITIKEFFTRILRINVFKAKIGTIKTTKWSELIRLSLLMSLLLQPTIDARTYLIHAERVNLKSKEKNKAS